MRHYEIVLLVHPDQSEQVPAMIQRYTTPVQNSGGNIHRLENLGRSLLAYPINKLIKAHYVLINLECNQKTIRELRDNFHFNDAILRYLIIRQVQAITEPSPLAKAKEMRESMSNTMHHSSVAENRIHTDDAV